MTEKQAWNAISKAYATPGEERTSRQKSLTISGMCQALYELYYEYRVISREEHFIMNNKIFADLRKEYSGISVARFMFSLSDDDSRSAYCKTKAKEC